MAYLMPFKASLAKLFTKSCAWTHLHAVRARTHARIHIHTHTPCKECLNRETCPPANAPSQREWRQKSAVNAKRILANISLLYNILPSTFLTQSLFPLQWLPAGRKDLTLYSVISLYLSLLKQDPMACGAFISHFSFSFPAVTEKHQISYKKKNRNNSYESWVMSCTLKLQEKPKTLSGEK